MKYGGIYVDGDAITLKNLDPLRIHPATVGRLIALLFFFNRLLPEILLKISLPIWIFSIFFYNFSKYPIVHKKLLTICPCYCCISFEGWLAVLQHEKLLKQLFCCTDYWRKKQGFGGSRPLIFSKIYICRWSRC